MAAGELVQLTAAQPGERVRAALWPRVARDHARGRNDLPGHGVKRGGGELGAVSVCGGGVMGEEEREMRPVLGHTLTRGSLHLDLRLGVIAKPVVCGNDSIRLLAGHSREGSRQDCLGEEPGTQVAELHEQLREQCAQTEELRSQNQLVIERIGELEKKIAELEALKTPPPPWATANHPTREKPAGEKRRQRAADDNHGRRRSTPTTIVQHAYERCPDCAYELRGTAVARCREVIDVPASPVEVTEHQILKRYCPACRAWKTPKVDFTGIVLGQGRTGVRLASLIATLRAVHRLPLAHIQALLTQVYDLRLSVGGIQDIVARLSAQLAPVRHAIAAQTRASPSQHMDETGWRENGQNGYIWAQATEGPTATRVYTYKRSRAGAVADEVLGDDAGVLVNDGYATYDHLPCSKQRCWTHILRTAHEVTETHPEDSALRTWTGGLKSLYTRARAVAMDATLSARERAAAASDAERRLRTLARCYRKANGHPAQALATWLHRHEGELFTFVRLPGVSGTHNLAERAIRPQVIARKISGGSRRTAGSHIRCDVATVFFTYHARGLNPFAACLAALQTPLPQL